MLDIKKCLTISDAHLSSDSCMLLDEEPNTDTLGLSVYHKEEYGYYIDIDDNVKKRLTDKEASGLPEDIYDCLQFAVKHDCALLCIDCDGPEVEGLPIPA